MSYTINYERATRTGTKNLPCPGCGKKVRRQRTFGQTLNPWNKDPESGLPRTRGQIWTALAGEIAKWEQAPETCSGCDA